MSLAAARIRISRVRMKNGGADVRVLHRNPPSRITKHAQSFVDTLAEYEDPPSAYVAIAFWADDKEPWRAPYIFSWDTCDRDLPLPRLIRVAAAQIAVQAPTDLAVGRVMRQLGYVRDEDPPEDSA